MDCCCTERFTAHCTGGMASFMGHRSQEKQFSSSESKQVINMVMSLKSNHVYCVKSQRSVITIQRDAASSAANP